MSIIFIIQGTLITLQRGGISGPRSDNYGDLINGRSVGADTGRSWDSRCMSYGDGASTGKGYGVCTSLYFEGKLLGGCGHGDEIGTDWGSGEN